MKLTVVFLTADVFAGWIVEMPYTNWFETVYINDGKHLLRVDANFKGEFVIEEGTEIIGEHSFGGCYDITSVIIPDSVTNIMETAFYACRSITNVVFGNGLKTIEDKSFMGCDRLEKLDLPDSLETIGYAVFAATKNKEIKIGNGLRNVGMYAFGYDDLSTNKLENINISISHSNQWLRVENGKIVSKKRDDE